MIIIRFFKGISVGRILDQVIIISFVFGCCFCKGISVGRILDQVIVIRFFGFFVFLGNFSWKKYQIKSVYMQC